MSSVAVPHENLGLSASLFVPTFADADPPCGLTDALIAYWFGNRSAGIADDVHTNNLDLTDVNTVTSNPGHVYPLARQYTAANTEYHTRPGDDALLSTGDVDFTLAVWIYSDAWGGVSRSPVSKWDADPNNEYLITYDVGADRYVFYVSADGTAATGVTANNYGSPPLSTWALVIGWHDSIMNTINIQVNNGTVDSLAHSTGVYDSSAVFRIGRRQDAGGPNYWDGRIGPTAMWKSAAGGGGVLTDAQRTCLFNASAGLKYKELT